MRDSVEEKKACRLAVQKHRKRKAVAPPWGLVGRRRQQGYSRGPNQGAVVATASMAFLLASNHTGPISIPGALATALLIPGSALGQRGSLASSAELCCNALPERPSHGGRRSAHRMAFPPPEGRVATASNLVSGRVLTPAQAAVAAWPRARTRWYLLRREPLVLPGGTIHWAELAGWVGRAELRFWAGYARKWPQNGRCRCFMRRTMGGGTGVGRQRLPPPEEAQTLAVHKVRHRSVLCLRGGLPGMPVCRCGST